MARKVGVTPASDSSMDMKHYAGLDVSLAETAICVIDENGVIVRKCKVPSEPEPISAWLAAIGSAGDVLASLTTMVWNAPSKSWKGGATMADASLNRRMTVRLGDAVASAQLGVVGLDGQIELEALRLYGLPEAVPALLCGSPTLPVGQREFAVVTTLDLPNLAAGAVHLVDVTVPGARRGDHAEASLASSTRFIELASFGRTTPSA